MSKKSEPSMLASLLPPPKVERSQPSTPLADQGPISRGPQQANRVGRVMVAAYFGSETSFALRELTVKLSRKRGQRVTLQDALGEAIALIFEKHGSAPPDEISHYLAM